MLFLLPASHPFFYTHRRLHEGSSLRDAVHLGHLFFLKLNFLPYLSPTASSDFMSFLLTFFKLFMFPVQGLNMVDESACCRALQNALCRCTPAQDLLQTFCQFNSKMTFYK